MRILVLAQRVPYPPNRGDKIPAYHYIRHLAQHHEVNVACLADGPDDLVNVKGLEPLVKSVDAVPLSRTGRRVRALAALLGRRPLTVAYFDEPELRRQVRARVAREAIDLAIVFGSGMTSYVEEFADLPRIVQFVDLDSLKWQDYAAATYPPQRWVYATEARRLLGYERHLAATFAHSLVCSTRELEAFRRLIPDAPVRCIRNGVDLDYFRPRHVVKTANALVFTGVMNYLPNVDGVDWFCREILPLIQQQVPNTTFTICGSAPSPKVKALAKLPGVSVTGAVPDVRTYLARSSVGVVPLRIARGIQNKLLEAMAMGLPAVATTSAWRGIEAKDGRDLLVADEPAAFAAAVVQLLQDQRLRQTMGQAARETMETHYRWEHTLAQLDEVCALATASSACPCS